MTIPDISEVEQRFHAMDVRGQIVRNRKAVLDELITSLRVDFDAGRFQAVVIHYRIFLHHAVNALLVHTISDSKILAGQTTPSGSDTEKVQKLFDDPLDPNPVSKALCDGLSKTLHATNPSPEDAQGVAVHLMKSAEMCFDLVVKVDIELNKWWDELRAGGVTSSRFEIKAKKRTRNP